MADISQKRKAVEALVYKVLDTLDPTKSNSKLMKETFDAMSDSQFDKFMRDLASNPKQQMYLEIIEYDESRRLTYENLDKAAKILGTALFEYVYLPYINKDDDNIVRTPQRVPVGYIREKRMMQTLEKKNSGSTSIEKRSMFTGQVVGDDKNGRNSDVETYSMLAIGAEKGLKELMGPRADDTAAKDKMYADIANNGYTSLDELPNDPMSKISMNTLNTYFILQGFKTNLVKGGDILPVPKDPDDPNA